MYALGQSRRIPNGFLNKIINKSSQQHQNNIQKLSQNDPHAILKSVKMKSNFMKIFKHSIKINENESKSMKANPKG